MATYKKYWGKADKDDRYHLLPYHCLDVAAVANCWWQQDFPLQQTFQHAIKIEPAQIRAWLLFFITLHDLGKFDVRFQLKARKVALKLQPLFAKANQSSSCKFYHGVWSYSWFEIERIKYGFENYSHEHELDWMLPVASHHGIQIDAEKPSTKFAAPTVIQYDSQARQQWVAELRELFLAPVGIQTGDEPPKLSQSVQHLLAGFCSISDWIGSNQDYFPYDSDSDKNLADYLKSRHPNAKKAIQDFGLYCKPIQHGGMHIFPEIETPRGVQTLVDNFPLKTGLTLIEAPTGSGKTEAALAYASRLLAAGLADSIIFALPTQTTANAMLERIEAVASKLFPKGNNIVLAHGKAKFNPNFKRFKENGKSIQGKEEAITQCSEWLGKSRKRVFLGQIGVCTVDQVLMSVLPMRHNFVRSFSIQKSILIIDEIHAYDAYMYGLIERVLEAQVGGSVILLSATLPSHQKQQLFKAWKFHGEPTNTYPLVSHVSNKFISFAPTEKPESRSVSFTLEITENMLPSELLLNQALETANKGAKVAIICNLVHDAQNIWQQLKQLNQNITLPIQLFHSRFRFCDRQKIETSICKQYGKKSIAQGQILVATQVVEQSLDLDFDWMITQLCPVDSLFQRLGRLHRHENKFRVIGFEQPACTVLIPEGEYPKGQQFIYGDTRVLWRTQKLLEQNKIANFPEVYRDWIEFVYQEGLRDEPDVIKQQYVKFEMEQEAKRICARNLAKEDTILSDSDDNVARLTRDGEMSLNVVLTIECNEFLDGISFKELDDWQWWEALGLQAIPVPHSWNTLIELDKLRGDEKHYFLRMRECEDGSWVDESQNFIYSDDLGLKKVV